MPIVRPARREWRLASAITWSRVGIRYLPLNCCGRSGNGWTARSVLISASVKSEANQPSSTAPSIVALRLRPANSGWAFTSVVFVMFGSWRAISCPSLVETRSGSM